MSDGDDLVAASFTNISDTSTSQPSIIEHHHASAENDDEELDDLPSPSDTDSEDITISEEEESDAEREWKESMQQFELLMSLVLIPYVGKYFGRKFAYWGWKQYMEWQYPVEVVTTSKAAFRGAGIVGVVASSL